MSSFDEIDPEKTSKTLVSEQLKKWLLEVVQNKNTPHYLHYIRNATEGLKFLQSIAHLIARIPTYCTDSFERFNAVDYGDVKFEKPKHTIKLIFDRLKAAALNPSMGDQVKVEPGIRKTFENSFRVLNVMLQLAKLLGNR